MSWPIDDNSPLGMPWSDDAETYGIVNVEPNGVTITAAPGQLYAWAHRPGYSWPCSTLAQIEETLAVTFDSNGLLDIEGDEGHDIPGDELSAWVSDVLADVLPTDHPAYYVAVGQFKEV